MCVFFCLFIPGPWADLHQTWREGGGRPHISLRGSFFERSGSVRSNVNFFFSVCFPTSPRSLCRSLGRWRAALDISSRGSVLKGRCHRGQRSNFYISAVLRPIWMKLGECIQVDP